jgi:hypothetical protein
VHASSLVLATGGRQADAGVRRSLIAGEALLPPLRGNAYSRGDGAGIALELGAQTNFANKGFYGHLFADGVEPIAPLDFITFALYHSEEGVLFDRAGRGSLTRLAATTTTRWPSQNGRPGAAAVVGGGAGACGRPALRRRKPADGPLGFSRDRGGRVDSAADARRSSDRARLGVRPHGGRARRARGSRPARNAAGLRCGRGARGHDDVWRNRRRDDGRAADGEGRDRGLYVAGGDTSDVYHRGYAGGLRGGRHRTAGGAAAARLAAAVPATA